MKHSDWLKYHPGHPGYQLFNFKRYLYFWNFLATIICRTLAGYLRKVGKIALSLGGCPSQVIFCPRLVLGLSWACLHMSLVALFCPSNVLVLPLFCHELAHESAQNPLDVLAMTFFHRRLLVGLWKVHKKATFDPHQILCLSLEMVDLNMSATSP